MELICEKYKEKMPADSARCRRPNEYCKFRAACMIHFLSREKARQERMAPGAGRQGGDGTEKE